MRIISRKTLIVFWEKHPDAKPALETWFYQAKHAKWETPANVKQAFQTVSVLPNNRLVFNIKGSKYRLVVLVLFSQGKLFIRFVGTHAEYDRIDATKI